MSFMPWSEALQLGIETIDNQHHWLVDATNALHDELSTASPDRAAIGRILEGLVEYTVNHFVLEEELFLRFGYQENAAHKAEHDGFTAKVMQLLLKFEQGENVGLDTMELLKTWLQHHILIVDRAYVPFLKAHGVV